MCSIVTVSALQLTQRSQIPLQVTSWYRKTQPTFADHLALARWHLWRARYGVNSAAEPDSIQLPWEAIDLLINGLPLTA
jgi:hypothetical protein